MFFLLFHRLLRPRIVLAILALGPGAMFGQSVAGTLPEDYLPGLKAILTDALNLAPRMLDQRIALAQADVDKMAANSALYPRLTGGAGYGVSSARSASATSSSSSSSSGFTYGLTLSQPLFQEGAIKAQSDIAKLGQQIAQKNYQAAYLSLASTLRYQYLQLVVKKAMLTQTRLQVATQDKELVVKRDSIARGESAPSELPSAEAAAETVRLAADRQALDFENSKRLFSRLAGGALPTDDAIPDSIPEPRLADGAPAALLAAFLRGGIDQTPQAQTYALYLRQNDLRAKVAKYTNYPKFSLSTGASVSANTSSDSFGNVSQGFVQGRNAGVSMGLTFFDAGSAKAAKLGAANARRTTERQLQAYLDTTRDDATSREKQVSLEYRAMALAEQNRRISLGLRDLDRQQVLTGLKAPVDAERSEISYRGTEISAFGARASFLQQWADFVSLVGADPMVNQLPANLRHGQ
jgi:outer membrane protein TolC